MNDNRRTPRGIASLDLLQPHAAKSFGNASPVVGLAPATGGDILRSRCANRLGLLLQTVAA